MKQKRTSEQINSLGPEGMILYCRYWVQLCRIKMREGELKDKDKTEGDGRLDVYALNHADAKCEEDT